MPESIKVGVLTEVQGAHLAEFFSALAETPEAVQVAVADPSGMSRPQAEELLKGKLQGMYGTHAELLEKFQPHLVIVTLEPRNSPAAIAAALSAGCHVLSEKPGCLKAEEFEPLVRLAQSKHLHLMLALANRPHAPVREARRLVRQGKLGRIFGMSMHLVADQARLKRADYRESWRGFKARAGGGHLIWLGIHWLDLATYITGLKVEQVAGFTGVVGGQPIDVEDSAAVALRYSDGVFGTLTSGFYLDLAFKENLAKYQSELKIWGEHGWLRLASFEDEPLLWYSSRLEGPPHIERYEYPAGKRSYQPFVRSAVRASAGLEEAPITPDESLHVLRTIYALYRAAETGQTQTVG